ncbi:S4 domain-containing protein [Akkermansia muciniphila]|nr:S4 domain-containing protein [Akkermansia muciniphila]
MSKQRLDILLVSRNLVESRELAQRLIIAGEVSVGGASLHQARSQG